MGMFVVDLITAEEGLETGKTCETPDTSTLDSYSIRI